MTEDLTTLEVTAAQLAALTGYTDRHIRRFAESGVLERVGRNRYRLGQALPALLEELAKGGDSGAQLTAERVRKLKAEATLTEIELAKAQGEVALVAEFEQAQNHAMGILRTNMMLVPSRAEMQLLGETDSARFKAVLKEEIVLALRTAAETKVETEELMEDEIND